MSVTLGTAPVNQSFFLENRWLVRNACCNMWECQWQTGMCLPLQYFQFYSFSIGSMNDTVEQPADSNISCIFLLNFVLCIWSTCLNSKYYMEKSNSQLNCLHPNLFDLRFYMYMIKHCPILEKALSNKCHLTLRLILTSFDLKRCIFLNCFLNYSIISYSLL